MNLSDLYTKVEERLEKIDFLKFFSGFKKLKFALCTSNECFFDNQYIEKPSNFIANTAVLHNNEYVAIWQVSEDYKTEKSIDILASKMIHEMFHGFQNMNNETRFPNEIDALFSYKYSDENLKIKLKENQLIAELAKNFDISKLNLLFSLRKYRRNHFYDEYLYETKIEQIEGTANYVELCSLKQLSFELYYEKLEQIIKSITEPKNFFPIRIISYDIGCLLLNILKENKIPFDEGFSEFTFSESLLENVNEATNTDVGFSSIQSYINSHFSKAREIISKAIAKNEVICETKEKILGVNVYNAVYIDGFIISYYFVMYGDENSPVIKYGNFVLETDNSSNGYLTKIYNM